MSYYIFIHVILPEDYICALGKFKNHVTRLLHQDLHKNSLRHHKKEKNIRQKKN